MIRTKTRIAVARGAYSVLRLARGPWRDDRVTVRRGGIKWRLDLREGIDLSIYLFGAFEPSVVRTYERLVRTGDTVVDVGANIGSHTLPLARAVGPQGKVFAFEPTSFAFDKLTTNLALNPELMTRVVPERAMLVQADADPLPEQLYSSWPVTGRAELHPQHRGQLMGTSQAESVTLDAYVRQAGLEAVNFVKIDVDGNEDHVLSGAQDTIVRFRPAMIVELAPYIYDGAVHSFETLVDLLTLNGYVLSTLRKGRPLPGRADLLRGLIPDGGSLNALCLPRP